MANANPSLVCNEHGTDRTSCDADCTEIPAGHVAIAGYWRDPVTGQYVNHLVGTYKRLRDQSWGVRVVGSKPRVGAFVVVFKANGQRQSHTIGTIGRAKNTLHDAVWLCNIVDAGSKAKPDMNPLRDAARDRNGQVIAPGMSNPRVIEKPIAATGPEMFTAGHVAAAAHRGDLVAGASAEGNGILTGFQGRGPMTLARVLATLAEAGMPAEWAPAAKSAHAHAGRVLNALNQLGYVCRADTKRRKGHDAANAEDAAYAMMVATDAKLEGRHYDADHVVNTQTDGIPTWSARWEIAVGRGRAAEIGSAFGTVVMIATLDQNGALFLESDNEALTRRVREDFEARVTAVEFQAADVSAWLASVLVSKFHAARLGGNWYVRRQYAAQAERLLTAFSRRWGQNWMLPALPIATTEQLCTGLANGLDVEGEATWDAFAELTRDGKMTSRRAEGFYSDLKALAVRAYGLQTVIGAERVSNLVDRLCVSADGIAKEISKPLPPFASLARSLAPRAA